MTQTPKRIDTFEDMAAVLIEALANMGITGVAIGSGDDGYGQMIRVQVYDIRKGDAMISEFRRYNGMTLDEVAWNLFSETIRKFSHHRYEAAKMSIAHREEHAKRSKLPDHMSRRLA